MKRSMKWENHLYGGAPVGVKCVCTENLVRKMNLIVNKTYRKKYVEAYLTFSCSSKTFFLLGSSTVTDPEFPIGWGAILLLGCRCLMLALYGSHWGVHLDLPLFSWIHHCSPWIHHCYPWICRCSPWIHCCFPWIHQHSPGSTTAPLDPPLLPPGSTTALPGSTTASPESTTALCIFPTEVTIIVTD